MRTPGEDAAVPAGGSIDLGRGEPEQRDLEVAQRAWLDLLRGESSAGLEALTGHQWDCLADEATRHHLRGVTYRRLADHPLSDRAPLRVRERLRAFYVETATRNALAYRQVAGIVKALGERGIPVLLLKGLHLSRFVYAEPGLRSMADADIMVPRDRLPEAERLFLGQGFGPVPRPDLEQFCTWSNHLAKLVKPGAPVVELHWGIERPTSPFRIDLEGLWQRSLSATLEGAPVRLLAPEDLLLHLVLHLSYHHRFDRSALKGLVDIATVTDRLGGTLDWDVLTARAAAWGASGYLYTTLRLAEAILDARVPAAVLATLPHDRADEDVVDVAHNYMLEFQHAVPRAYLQVAQRGNVLDRMRAALAKVFLPRAKMAEIYGLGSGSVLVYPYYGARLASLLVRRAGLLFRALFRTREMRQTLAHEEARLRLQNWGAPPPAE